jgi:hypothetical protein
VGERGKTDLLCWLHRGKALWLGGTLGLSVRRERRGVPVRNVECALPRHGGGI